MTPAIRAAIGLGANLGDAVGTLRGAVEALAVHDGVTLRAVSRFYRTPAWGRQDQPDFVNAVALVDTSLAPRALLDLLLAVEAEFGRHRIAGERWGPRTLDLDLLWTNFIIAPILYCSIKSQHIHINRYASMTGKSHLCNGRKQTTIRTVMVSQNRTFIS